MKGRRISTFTIVVMLLGIIVLGESFLIFRSVFSIKGDNQKLKDYVLSLEAQNKRLKDENRYLSDKINDMYNPKITPPDIPSDWLLYRYLESGFEIGYPKGCKVINEVSTGETNKEEGKLNIISNDPGYNSEIIIVSLNKYRNINDYIKGAHNYRIYVKESIYIGSIKYDIYKLSGEKRYSVLLKNKSHIIEISSPSEDFLIKVVGTFKFI